MVDVFFSEVLGTFMLLLLGCGVVANVSLSGSKGEGGGFLLVNVGWGFAVMAGVYAGFKSGAHINPAVTVGLLANGAAEYAPDVAVTFTSTITYFAGQMVGAFLGAVVCWLAYKDLYARTEDKEAILGTFSTGPAVRNYTWNVVTEAVGTFVLVFVILTFGENPAQLGPLPVAFLVLGIGNSLGGPTGYAINPARDLGPRIAHAVLPIPGKGGNDWAYAWVPIVGPVIGGALAGLVGQWYLA